MKIKAKLQRTTIFHSEWVGPSSFSHFFHQLCLDFIIIAKGVVLWIFFIILICYYLTYTQIMTGSIIQIYLKCTGTSGSHQIILLLVAWMLRSHSALISTGTGVVVTNREGFIEGKIELGQLRSHSFRFSFFLVT